MTVHAMTINVDETTRDAIFAEAKDSDTSPALLAGTMLREVVEQRRDYGGWLLREIEQAMRDADDPSIERIPHEVVMEESRAQRAEWRARAVSTTS